jgi:hypothetical protein
MGNGDTRVDASSEGRVHLIAALTLAMDYHTGQDAGTVSHWCVVDGAMRFGWHASMERGVPLPAKMGKEAIADLILSWLLSQDYGRAPDTDGDASRGWRVFQPRDNFYCKFAVEPHWLVYGK